MVNPLIERPDWLTKAKYIQLKAEGFTDEYIAAKLVGCSRPVFIRMKNELNLKPGDLKPRPVKRSMQGQIQIPEWFTMKAYKQLKKDGWTDKEIAKKKLFCSVGTMIRFKKELGIEASAAPSPRTKKVLEKVANIKKLRKQGLTQAQVAERLGCSIVSIYKLIKKYG